MITSINYYLNSNKKSNSKLLLGTSVIQYYFQNKWLGLNLPGFYGFHNPAWLIVLIVIIFTLVIKLKELRRNY